MGMTHSHLLSIDIGGLAPTPISDSTSTSSRKSRGHAADSDGSGSGRMMAKENSLMHDVRKRTRSMQSCSPGCVNLQLSSPTSLPTGNPSTAALTALATSDFTPSRCGQGLAEARARVSLRATMALAGAVVLLLMGAIAVLEVEAGVAVEGGSGEGGVALPAARPGIAGAAAKAAMLRLGGSNVTVQTEEQWGFRLSSVQQEPPVFVQCNSEQTTASDGQDCIQAWTLTMQLEGGAQPAAVVVLLPGAARPAAAGDDGCGLGGRHWEIRAALLGGLLALFAGIIVGVNILVLRPLRVLACHMSQLGDLDCAHETSGLAALRGGRRSGFREVWAIQEALDRIVHSLETFGRFIPVTVVRSIVHGDERAMRLHVSERDVTIMFSDVRDFTSLCENLSQRDLLFVVTRYLSVMTRVVEMYDGMVAEVLGDGLLAFWNTPDKVTKHAANACAAALAQQRALELLNDQFETMGLPRLAMRVGLHTGPVLSGTIGSERRMKFGCLGDSVNLASRLEGLCKRYSVGIICSGATRDALEQTKEEENFLLRKLDLVQVKGKLEPTRIYEVMGRVEPGQSLLSCSRTNSRKAPATAPDDGSATAPPSGPGEQDGASSSTQVPLPTSTAGGSESPTGECLHLVRWYERALDAYQAGRFLEARDLALALSRAHPEDVPSVRLFERADRCVGPAGEPKLNLSEAELAAWTGVVPMEDK